MLDGHYKSSIDRFWNYLARGLAALGLTPNQVTWAGLVLVLLDCALFPLHGNSLWFGLSLGLIFALDALDGAVARITDATSLYGGYLDAVVDRYQEVAVYLTLAWYYDYWGVCLFALSGSLLISYNKARTAVEIAIDNNRWPDLLERMERIVILCLALVLEPLFSVTSALGSGVLWHTLAVLGGLTHLTAVQRFFRARAMLIAHDRSGNP